MKQNQGIALLDGLLHPIGDLVNFPTYEMENGKCCRSLVSLAGSKALKHFFGRLGSSGAHQHACEQSSNERSEWRHCVRSLRVTKRFFQRAPQRMKNAKHQ